MPRTIPISAAFLITIAGLGALGTPSASSAEPAAMSPMLHISDTRITESSGLESSAYFSGILYTHNDSGDGPRFFAVGPDGTTKAVYTLKDARSWDWEDISAGPDRTLWLGDIGDNFTRKAYICVFRVAEPTKLASANLPWTQFDFTYADGRPHNAEALLVSPTTGRLYVVTKQKTGAGVYQAPLTLKTSGYNILSRVASAPPLVTGGDFSPDGKRIVLRTYGKAYLYSHVGGAPTIVDLPSEKQGESVAFTRNSADLLVGSEGRDSPVYRVSTP